MSCQQVPAAPALNPYPRSVQVGEFEVATGGGIWVAIRGAQECRFCHTEFATSPIEAEINHLGFAIIELQNCD